jgi:hypothetical protein
VVLIIFFRILMIFIIIIIIMSCSFCCMFFMFSESWTWCSVKSTLAHFTIWFFWRKILKKEAV